MINTPAYRQQWILEELKKDPLLSFGRCFRVYLAKFSKSEQTFSKDWKQAKKQIETYQKKANEEKERVSIEIEKEAVKQGLKTKIDRVLTLQKLVDDCVKDLENKSLSLQEKNQTRKTLKELQSEISKIEGDYAPTQNTTELQVKEIVGMIIK